MALPHFEKRPSSLQPKNRILTGLLTPLLVAILIVPLTAAAEDKEIFYTRLSIEQVDGKNHPLFDTVVVGPPMGTSIALLTQGDSYCSLEVHDAADGKLKVRFDDHRFCIDVEYEDGYSTYNMPEYKPFLKSNQPMITGLLASFNIRATQLPDLPDVGNPKQVCAQFAKINVCGEGVVSLK